VQGALGHLTWVLATRSAPTTGIRCRTRRSCSSFP
jgi:hypothetical protein